MKKYILCLLLSLFVLTSCVAGSTASDTLWCGAYIGESLDIKLKVKKYAPNGHGGQFVCDKSLIEIQNEILKQNDCQASLYKSILLIEKTINGMKQICVIEKYGNFYIYEQPFIGIFESDEEYSSEKAVFFAPTFHLNTERDSTTHEYHLVENQWYSIDCTEEEYMDVYDKTGMFAITKSDFYTLNIKSSVPNRFEDQSDIYIEFKVENDLTYIKYYM